jgi:hypothetical protein
MRAAPLRCVLVLGVGVDIDAERPIDVGVDFEAELNADCRTQCGDDLFRRDHGEPSHSRFPSDVLHQVDEPFEFRLFRRFSIGRFLEQPSALCDPGGARRLHLL